MQEKQFCCCGSSGWTRVIAWFQITASFIATILWTLVVITDSATAFKLGKNPQHLDGKSLTTRGFQVYKSLEMISLGISIKMLLITFMAFVMGIVLLRGSIKRNPWGIYLWIVYTVVMMALCVFKTIVECIFFSSEGEFPIIFLTLALTLAIEGLCLWVVMTHKKEIEASAKADGPLLDPCPALSKI